MDGVRGGEMHLSKSCFDDSLFSLSRALSHMACTSSHDIIEGRGLRGAEFAGGVWLAVMG